MGDCVKWVIPKFDKSSNLSSTKSRVPAIYILPGADKCWLKGVLKTFYLLPFFRHPALLYYHLFPFCQRSWTVDEKAQVCH